MNRLLAGLLFVACAVSARGDFREFREVPTDQRLESALKSIVEITLKEFPKLTADNLAISVIDLSKPEALRQADYHGDAPFLSRFLGETFLHGRSVSSGAQFN